MTTSETQQASLVPVLHVEGQTSADPHDPRRVSQAQGALQSSRPASPPLSWRAMEESFRELRGSSKIRFRETAYGMWR